MPILHNSFIFKVAVLYAVGWDIGNSYAKVKGLFRIN